MSRDNQLCTSAHHRILKCVVLLVILKLGDSLKLTPVQNQSRKLELDQETKSISVAFSEAKELISNESSVISENHAKQLLQNHVMKKLHSSIERWNSIEDRLRSAILTTDQKQVSMFDEALGVIAASRVMLGQLFWRSREDAVALKELEPSCPLLWEYDIAKTSLDSDGWLDCYSSLGDIYIRMGRLEQAVEQEKDLIARMPWLALTFSGKPTNTKLRTLATILHLTRVTGEERRMISVHIKNAWRIGESLRAQLNEIVSEFIAAETDKRRMNIYISAKNVIEEALQRFVQDSNVNIIHYSSKSRTETDTESKQITNGESPLENSTPLSAKEAETVAESTAQTRKRESTLLNSALRIEINREASYYLHTMDGIIEGGKHFLPAVRIREQARALDRFQSTNSVPPGRENPFGLNDPSATSITSAPMGFQSRDQVMQVFEYFLAHRAKRLEQLGNTKQSATSERFVRRGASAPSSSNKKSSTSTSQSRTKKPAGETRRSRSTHFTNKIDPSPISEQSYGFIGMIIAILAGSGYMMRNTKHSQKHSSYHSGSKTERSTAEDKESGYAMWALVISAVGLTAASKILRTWGKVITRMSHLGLKLTTAFSRSCQRTHLAVSPLLLWCRRALADRQSRIHREETALTAWTNTCKSTTSKLAINGSSSIKKQASQKITKIDDKIVLERVPTNKPSSSSAVAVLKNDIASAGHDNRAVSMVTQKKQTKSKKRASKALSNQRNSKEIGKTPIFSEVASADSNNVEVDSSSDADDDEFLHDLVTQPTQQVTDNESSSRSESLDAPSSPSSVTNTGIESSAGYFSEDRIFDDSYWRSIDEEEEGEGAWIETSSQLLKGKSRRIRGSEKQFHEATSSSQRPMRTQHNRKTSDTAFSLTFGNPKDRFVNNTNQPRRMVPSRRTPLSAQSSFNRITQHTLHNTSTTTSAVPPLHQHRPVKDLSLSASAVLRPPQKENSRTLHPTDKLTQSPDIADFPPLKTAYPAHGHSMGSSVENSTDMEDHSSISDDSHLSTPRSRSLSAANFQSHEQDEGQDLLMAQQQTHSLHPMQIPYYPVGYMPMQMPDMSQMMYDPSSSTSSPVGLNQFIMPPVALSPEQIRALGQHRQGMMMMPYPSMYMVPHSQYDTMLPAPIMQHMMSSDEHVLYNVQASNQIYYETAINQPAQSGGAVSMELSAILPEESYIVDTVRLQIEYYFSKTNLLHDKYLRSKMDPEGFVALSEIANWNRIRRIGATPHMILQAVQTSNSLEIMEHWEVAAVRGNLVGTYALAPEVVLSTLIRCAENPLSWIPELPVCASENCVTSAESVEYTVNTTTDL